MSQNEIPIADIPRKEENISASPSRRLGWVEMKSNKKRNLDGGCGTLTRKHKLIMIKILCNIHDMR
jgi:hypothetical protein